MLSQAQIDRFWRDGYLMVENAVSEQQLNAVNRQLRQWVEESRQHTEPYGPPTIDERPRFDMGEEHSADSPALRRVNNPCEISDAYFDVMHNAATVDMIADLIGADIKFHHCKINLKLKKSKTVVYYHQDFSFTPHTNDDMVTALLMLDDMTAENGCLMVVPGSHKGPLYSLYDGDNFVGRVGSQTQQELTGRQVPIYGKAGSVCLMHTRVAHGSEANRSERARGLYICVYTAADAFPIARNPMPNIYEGRIVRGNKTRVARCKDTGVEIPEQPKSASFFTVQGQDSATA